MTLISTALLTTQQRGRVHASRRRRLKVRSGLALSSWRKEGHEGMRFDRNITALVSGTGENNLRLDVYSVSTRSGGHQISSISAWVPVESFRRSGRGVTEARVSRLLPKKSPASFDEAELALRVLLNCSGADFRPASSAQVANAFSATPSSRSSRQRRAVAWRARASQPTSC